MPALRRLFALSIACLTLVVAGCGDTDQGKLSSKQGATLVKSVENAQAAFESGQCADARASAAAGATKLADFKGELDEAMRDNLIDGFTHLEKQLAANCDKPEATATPSATATEEPTETPEPTPSPTPEATETPSPTPEPTVTTEPTAVPTPPDDTDGTGGVDPGDQGELPSEDPSA